ncbi:hypothetical protein HKX48_000314 [Thoreauomyces humboldtii]|nr:hypothetical protein HKX48_000314 [Thoreauomyces humboldtii]
MRSTIATVFDFILDTFGDSLQKLPSLQNLSLVERHAVMTFDTPEPREFAMKPVNPMHNLPSGDQYYACVLWNDEAHSFHEVIDQVKEALDASADEGKVIAEAVDNHGRQVLKVSANTDELFRIADKVSEIALVVSIRSARETFREEVAGVLLDWLKDISKQVVGARTEGGTLYEPVDTLVQQLVATELLSPRRKMKKHYATHDGNHDENVTEAPECPEAWIKPSSTDPSLVEDRDVTDDSRKLRIDHLIVSDIKLWKQARNASRELFIGTMVTSGDHFKKKMGEEGVMASSGKKALLLNPISVVAVRFSKSYLPIITNYLLHDREPELSIINFSVQLFTVPTIGHYIATHTDLLPTIFHVMKAFYLSEVLPERFPLKNFLRAAHNAEVWSLPRYPKLTCDSDAARSRRYWHFFQDARYVLAAQRLVKGGASVLRAHDATLDTFLDLLRVWQAMHPQTRYTRSHIEYEQEHWVQAFNLGLQLGRMVQMVADCLSRKDEKGDLCVEAIKTVRVLDAWCRAEVHDEVARVLMQQGQAAGLGVNMNQRVPSEDGLHTVEYITGKPLRVPFYNVASQPVSFHHPLQWFLAYLIGDMLDATWDCPDGLTILQHIFRGDDGTVDLRLVARIMEGPLQTTVLLSQIRAGVWVRNGLTLRAQATHYRSTTLREHHDQDLFLLQIYLVLVGPDMFMTALLDRYDLVMWFEGNPRACANLNGLEDQQIGLLAEDFMEVLITLFGERSRMANMSPVAELERDIVHHLAVSAAQGVTYSELYGRVLERLTSSVDDFDAVLQTVSDFRFPEGTSDSGVYVLKEDRWKDVDPWYWHYSKHQREEIDGHLRARNKKNPIGGDAWWVPRLVQIPDTPMGFRQLATLVRSEVFINVVFYSFWNVFFGVVQSAVMVAEAVQIVALAIVSETVDGGDGSEFSKMAATCEVETPAVAGKGRERLTLLQLLLRVLTRESDADDDMKDLLKRIGWIVESVGGRGGDEAAGLVQAWRATWGGDAQRNIEKAEVSAKKKVDAKAAAVARKAAIMAQFALAQKKFVDENPDEESSEEEAEDEQHQDDRMDEEAVSTTAQPGSNADGMEVENDETREDKRLWEYPSGTCIFCQEETAGAGTETYGMLGLVQPSTVLRSVEQGNNNVSPAARLDEDVNVFMSTCGHLMHLTCFHSYYASIRTRHETQSGRNHPEDVERSEFLCPLCKTLGNCFVPVLWDAKEERIVPLREETAVSTWWERGLGDFAASLIRGEVGDAEGEIMHQFMTAITPHRGGREAAQSDPTYLYRRLIRVLSAAMNPEEHQVPLEGMSEMWATIAYTVECLEFTSRGKNVTEDAIPAVTDQVPGHALALLRALCEGLLTCSASEMRNEGSESRLEERGQELVWSIFSGVLEGQVDSVPLRPFLKISAMEAFGEIMFGVGVIKGGDDSFWEWASVLYVREIVAVLINVIETVGYRGLEVDIGERESDPGMCGFFLAVATALGVPDGLSRRVLNQVGEGYLKRAVRSALLGFFRQCALFGWIRCGIVFDTSSLPDDATEPERLRRCLRLPSLETICSWDTLLNENGITLRLVTGWCRQLNQFDPTYFALGGHPSVCNPEQVESYVRPSTPLYARASTLRVPSLIILPHRLDELFEESVRRVCKRCKQVPSDPALCLLCGTFVCSQSYCCQDEDKGECHIHARECGGDVGMFFIIKKCVIYLMHNENGCFIHPPYLDSHGEVDVGLRRGRPQFLNQKRYDELGKLWLNHGIPSFVARKIESTFDIGGWATL